MLSLLSLSLLFSACAHKHCGGCKDGACKMEKKDCGCGHKHDEVKKTEEKK